MYFFKGWKLLVHFSKAGNLRYNIMKIDFVDAKGILVRNKSPENWFGVHYNTNIYRGCQHNCIYCDSRSECYQIQEFENLIVKRNAPQLLDEALAGRRKKVTISNGSRSDPYIPAEKNLCLTQKILEIIIKYKYPFNIVTKSDLILRDIELLKEINKVFLSVNFTITTTDYDLARLIEPNAPSPIRRIHAIEKLAKENIYTGVLFQPILPYLLDTEKNIDETVYQVAKAGAKYIIPWFAVTTRKGQKEYFLDKLEKIKPGLKAVYLQKFRDQYMCYSEQNDELYNYFESRCKKHKIDYKMSDIMNYGKINPYKQTTLFDIVES